jgi:glycosyltransferase involved in cell wall biosynthesis
VDYKVTVIRERRADEAPGPVHIDGVPLVERQFPLPRKRWGFLRGTLGVLFLNAWILKKLLMGRYRIVVATDVHTALAPLFARWLKPFRLVYDSHEVMWALGSGSLLSGLYKLAENVTLRRCDLWLVPSATRAELVLREQGLKRDYLVYWNLPVGHGQAADRPRYRARLEELGVPADRFIVIFQGSLIQGRGVEVLTEAARSARYHLLIQGRGSAPSALQRKPHAGVTLLPPCENTEVCSWLSAADLSFVYYENNCVNSAHACSSKFYASVFAGIPILCNRLPAFVEFAEKHGGVVFFDDLDSSAINAQIEALVDNAVGYPALSEQMTRAREVLRAEFVRQTGEMRNVFRS